MNGPLSQVPLPLQQTQKQQPQSSRIAAGFHHASHYNNSMSGSMPGSVANRPAGTPAESVHEAAANPLRDPGLAAMTRQPGIGDTGLDGITALLRAREIVDRRP